MKPSIRNVLEKLEGDQRKSFLRKAVETQQITDRDLVEEVCDDLFTSYPNDATSIAESHGLDKLARRYDRETIVKSFKPHFSDRQDRFSYIRETNPKLVLQVAREEGAHWDAVEIAYELDHPDKESILQDARRATKNGYTKWSDREDRMFLFGDLCSKIGESDLAKRMYKRGLVENVGKGNFKTPLKFLRNRRWNQDTTLFSSEQLDRFIGRLHLRTGEYVEAARAFGRSGEDEKRDTSYEHAKSELLDRSLIHGNSGLHNAVQIADQEIKDPEFAYQLVCKILSKPRGHMFNVYKDAAFRARRLGKEEEADKHYEDAMTKGEHDTNPLRTNPVPPYQAALQFASEFKGVDGVIEIYKRIDSKFAFAGIEFAREHGRDDVIPALAEKAFRSVQLTHRYEDALNLAKELGDQEKVAFYEVMAA